MLSSFEVVVAADLDRGIARRGQVPWRLPGDMAYFRHVTATTADPRKQNAVLMGRRTWETLPSRFRPLPGRKNLVLSRRETLELPAGVLHASNLAEGLEMLSSDPSVESIFVIGGSMVYVTAIALPECRRIHYTRIAARFGCDIGFPRFEDTYELESIAGETEENQTSYRIEVWRNPRFGRASTSRI